MRVVSKKQKKGKFKWNELWQFDMLKLPGSPLAHFTTLTSCLSPNSLRLVRRAAAESGWAWSWPAFTTSGSMASRMFRKISCEWNVRLGLGDRHWTVSDGPWMEPTSSGPFICPIFLSLRAAAQNKTIYCNKQSGNIAL